MLRLLILFSAYIVNNLCGTTLTGIVQDSVSKKPLIGANVIIDGTDLGAATDADGKYKIESINPGDYSVWVSYMGYKTSKKSFSIIDNKTSELNIFMEPEAIKMETYVQNINIYILQAQLAKTVVCAKII